MVYLFFKDDEPQRLLGRPTLRLPCGLYTKAWLAMLLPPRRKEWPIQFGGPQISTTPHLLRFWASACVKARLNARHQTSWQKLMWAWKFARRFHPQRSSMTAWQITNEFATFIFCLAHLKNINGPRCWAYRRNGETADKYRLRKPRCCWSADHMTLSITITKRRGVKTQLCFTPFHFSPSTRCLRNI